MLAGALREPAASPRHRANEDSETRASRLAQVPAAGQGEKPGSGSVYPAEETASPGGNHHQVVNICWLNGALSTRRRRAQRQPWKVQFSQLGSE